MIDGLARERYIDVFGEVAQHVKMLAAKSDCLRRGEMLKCCPLASTVALWVRAPVLPSQTHHVGKISQLSHTALSLQLLQCAFPCLLLILKPWSRQTCFSALTCLSGCCLLFGVPSRPVVLSDRPFVLAACELQSLALLQKSLSSPSLLSADFCFYGVGHPSAQLWGRAVF